MKTTLRLRLLFLGLLSLPVLTSAQGTAFTYNGRLNYNGALVNGPHEMRFTLFDLDVWGLVVGGPLPVSPVEVANGLFTVRIDFVANVFTGPARWLEVAVRPVGVGNFVTLTPRQEVTSSPYAIRAQTAGTAANVNGGTVVKSLNGLRDDLTLAAGANLTITPNGNTLTLAAAGAGSSDPLAPGSVGAAQLASGAAAANLNAINQSAVPSGGLILSATESTTLLNAGYVKIGTVQGGDTWQQRINGTSPVARDAHTAVWTGSEMIVWGGFSGDTPLNDGGRYNPAGNSWTAVSTAATLSARGLHTAVWTGSEMIVWGGFNSTSALSDGGCYNPVGNNWTAVTTNGAPAGRTSHTAVWTGTEVIVWGGYNGIIYWKDGGRYNPAGNIWTAVTTNSAPAARNSHTAVWTGSEMIVWGGIGGSGYVNDGGRYNTAGNSWTAVTVPVAAPAARSSHTAVWTGSEMIVWGGFGGGGFTWLRDGGRYHPVANTWTAVSTVGAPSARYRQTAVWTGSEMIIWGGSSNSTYYADGGRYNPAGNTWAAVSTNGAPIKRDRHTAVWTGSEMIVWGGNGATNSFSELKDGGRYNAAANTWTAVTTNGAPLERYSHTAIWTGSEMIVWGGSGSVVDWPNGGRYNPTANTWTAIDPPDANERGVYPTAVWTGSEMITWGGLNLYLNSYQNRGWRYNPVANAWASVPTTGAPAGRAYHTAVWTGSEMIVWGGKDGSTFFNDGGQYNPVANSWSAVTTTRAPLKRYVHTAVWTGSEMIVWGGEGGGFFNDTWSFTPERSLFLYQRP